MKAFVAASQHWMDGETIRKALVGLPAASTLVVSNRTGGDALVKRIADEELALRVESFDLDWADDTVIRKSMIAKSDDDVAAAYFFCCDNSEIEFFVSRYARTHRIETQVLVNSFKP